VGSSPWEDKTAYALHCASSMVIVIIGSATAPLAYSDFPGSPGSIVATMSVNHYHPDV